MGWLQLLGTLAQAVVQADRNHSHSSSNPLGVSAGAARRARSFGSGMIGETARVTIIPPDPREEIERAEAETRRMLEEAYQEMIDERIDYGVRRMAERVEENSAKVIEIESHVNTRLDSLTHSVEDVQQQTKEIVLLQKKLNILLGAMGVLVALCGYLLYLNLKV